MVHIVCLTTFEEVLASICYMPYWAYTALTEQGKLVRIYEDITLKRFLQIEETGAFKKDDLLLFDVSSAPQIEFARVLQFRFRGQHIMKGIGYEPFVKQANLEYFTIENLEQGVFKYPFYQCRWKYGYATLDSHVKCSDNKIFYPMFFSVGCKRSCEYCYVPRAGYPYAVLPYAEVEKLLDHAVQQHWNIHIEDENFLYHPDAVKIIEALGERKIKWIMLTDSIMLSKFLREKGADFLQRNGHWLSEIGLESLALDKKQNLDPIVKSGLNVFYLTMTFLPDETIQSLNAAGEFYALHGQPYERLLPRLKTQSSVGGLGQFFQVYPETPYAARIGELGVQLSSTPTRLLPSFVGYKLLGQTPIAVRQPTADDLRWVDMYGSLFDCAYVLQKCDGCHSVQQVTALDPHRLAVFAVLCRLNCIKSFTETKEAA